jgi:excisionase family DNA binding protein
MDTANPYPSLTASQVAERIGVCDATLYRMLAAGTAPVSYKIGARRYWREADVLAWLETSCRDTRGRAA